MKRRLAVLIILLAVVCPLSAQIQMPLKPSLFWTDCPSILEFDDRWPTDGPGNSYERDFEELFKKLRTSNSLRTYFREWTAARQKDGEKVHALDLLGSGFFIKNADSMTGFRQGPIVLRPNEIAAGVVVPPHVYGDVRDDSTWTLLDRSLTERSISAFDLIVMRPVGGWSGFNFSNGEQELRFLNWIVRKTLGRLSARGEFYFALKSPPMSVVVNQNLLEKTFKEVWDKGFEMICATKGFEISCVVRRRPEPGP